MNKPKAIFCWSGGKDSAYCLHKVLTEKIFDVKYLLTTINDEFKRISMHGIREELLDLCKLNHLQNIKTKQKDNKKWI